MKSPVQSDQQLFRGQIFYLQRCLHIRGWYRCHCLKQRKQLLTHRPLGDLDSILTHWGRDKIGRHFADDIFICIFLDENVWIPIKISLKFVPKGPINNIPSLVQIMAWRRPGDKPLSEPMMVRLPTHIYVTRPQWVKSAIFLLYWCGIFRSSYDNALTWMSWDLSEDRSTLLQVMAWCGQATSHYLSQCWPRSLLANGVTRPQCVNSLSPGDVAVISTM